MMVMPMIVVIPITVTLVGIMMLMRLVQTLKA